MSAGAMHTRTSALGLGALSVALLLPACATLRARTAPGDAVHVEVPEAELTDLETSLSRTLHVEVENDGDVPIVVLDVVARGAGEGRRSLFVDAARDLRAFGYVPPGGRGRWQLGVRFPSPGALPLTVVARVRLARGLRGKLMEEVRLPKTGEERMIRFVRPLRVAPRGFPRAAAEARVGGRADDAVYCRELEAWVLVRGNDTFLVEVGQTTPFPGFALEAALLLDSDGPVVPILDEAGRLQEVPKGPALRSILDRARRRGLRVSVALLKEREVLRVAP